MVMATLDGSGGADYSARFGEAVDRFTAFEKRAMGGIMPEIDLRMRAAAIGRGWPGEMGGMAAATDG